MVVLFCLNVYGQDIIVKHDGSEIKANVLEITETTIRFKEFEFQDGPTRNINLSEIFMVIYESGRRENFSEYKKTTSLTKDGLNVKGNYFSIAPGYGNSYGGLGLRFQYVTPGNVRVGIHGGAGYFPSMYGWLLYSGGVQIYFWDYMYVDAQFGAFGVRSSYDGYHDYYKETELYGPSLLIGYDWFVTKHFGFNAASGISVDVRYGGIFWAIDSGLVFRF